MTPTGPLWLAAAACATAGVTLLKLSDDPGDGVFGALVLLWISAVAVGAAIYERGRGGDDEGGGGS